MSSLLVRLVRQSVIPVRSVVTVSTRSFSIKPKTVTLIPGDGIGPECCSCVTGVFAAAEVPIEWERFDHLTDDPLAIQEVIASISRTGVALKGPLRTPTDYRTPQSRNMQLRKALDLYANIVPVRHVKGIATRHSEVPLDFVVIRENTEGEYTGIEHEISKGVVESLKIITTKAATRIANRAFDYAASNNRKKVTAVHKANIQKLSDGEFIRACREVSKNYPAISYDEIIVDNCTMQLAMRPQQFDVLVTPNLYGAIVTNIASALVGGPGLLAGANVGKRGAIFESGARHVAMELAGKNQANPLGTLFASIMMLRHLGLDSYAERIERAVRTTVERDHIFTADVGGSATTRQVTHAVIQNL